MESHRKRMHDLIEQAANKKDVKSKWEAIPPKRPSQRDIEIAQSKGNLEEQYNLYDR